MSATGEAVAADEVLTTTRSVRRRLDFDRPVDDRLIRECVEIAMQAPAGSNVVTVRFLVVRDPDTRRAMGDIYRRAYEQYRALDGVYIGSIDRDTEAARAQQARSARSADHLAERLGDAPVLVLACADGMRVDGLPAMMSVPWLTATAPAAWSFMLAARARNLGTAWTTNHLFLEEEMADLLGIPFDTVQQVCLTPVAHTIGERFRPADRGAVTDVLFEERWPQRRG